MDVMAIAVTLLLSVGFGLAGSRVLLGGVLLWSARAVDDNRNVPPADPQSDRLTPPLAA
jgi:hypothetical protein